MAGKKRKSTMNNIVGCSDGSVYDHKLAGGYTWALYERRQDHTLRHIGITGLGREEALAWKSNPYIRIEWRQWGYWHL